MGYLEVPAADPPPPALPDEVASELAGGGNQFGEIEDGSDPDPVETKLFYIRAFANEGGTPGLVRTLRFDIDEYLIGSRAGGTAEETIRAFLDIPDQALEFVDRRLTRALRNPLDIDVQGSFRIMFRLVGDFWKFKEDGAKPRAITLKKRQSAAKFWRLTRYNANAVAFNTKRAGSGEHKDECNLHVSFINSQLNHELPMIIDPTIRNTG